MRRGFLIEFSAEGDEVPYTAFIYGWRRWKAIPKAAALIHAKYKAGKLRMTHCIRLRGGLK